jgi:DNA-binding GntR family transcriptional regulator
LAFVPRSQSALDEHRQILAAVIAHDEERAAQLMSEHIGKALAQAQQYEAYVIEVPLIQFRHK